MKKKTREAHASSFTGIGKSPTILKTWSRFPFGRVPTKFRVDQKHKSLRARKFIYLFFSFLRTASKYSFDENSRISLRIGGDAKRRQDFELSRVQYLRAEKKCCTVRFFGVRSIMNGFIENLGPKLRYCFVSMWMEDIRWINRVFYIVHCESNRIVFGANFALIENFDYGLSRNSKWWIILFFDILGPIYIYISFLSTKR